MSGKLNIIVLLLLMMFCINEIATNQPVLYVTGINGHSDSSLGLIPTNYSWDLYDEEHLA